MGAGFCLSYHEIDNIEVLYIKVWVYFTFVYIQPMCNSFKIQIDSFANHEIKKKMVHIFVRRIFPDFEVHMICGCLCCLDDEVVENCCISSKSYLGGSDSRK